MQLSDGLRDILKQHLNWSKPRLECFAGMLLALLRLKQINLTQLALAFSGEASSESRYRRLQRFFQKVHFDYTAVASMIMGMFGFTQYYLTLDRTNWQWGKKNINILVLAVVHRGTAIPVLWLPLNKKGNSNQKERIALLRRFIVHFGQANILGILGDREFIGDEWWQWLSSEKTPYLIRMRGNQDVTDLQGRTRWASAWFSDLKPGKSRCRRSIFLVGNQKVWLSCMRLENGELLILAGNRYFEKPFAVYGLRWEIENLFQCLKGRGFKMEDTRLIRYARIKKVVALLAIAFCWAHKTGEWKHDMIKKIRTKKHGRPAQNLFRYGLDHLTDNILHGLDGLAEVIQLLTIFLCPPAMVRGFPEHGKLKTECPSRQG